MNSQQANPIRRLFGLGVIQGLIDQVRLSWRLFQDPRVPAITKAIPLLTLAYIVSPVDLVLDVIPFLGQMDDIAILGAGLTLFISAAPKYVVNEHLSLLRGDVPPSLPPGTP
jgi:uncharacterized membrane protein YkvA (DUF1232 family)